MTMLTIDGSFGEGGGQIVRSSLALAVLTGQGVIIDNIRAKRKKSGLAKQHLTSVQAAAAVSNAEVHGASLGSSRLTFYPRGMQAGDYHFPIGTAGSTTLVLQTILMPLLLADGPSRVVIEGGTHNPLAPPADFLVHAYLPLINRMGPKVALKITRHGFYPAGGGRIEVEIEPTKSLQGLELLHRGPTTCLNAKIILANLPQHVAQREIGLLRAKSGWPVNRFSVQEVESHSPGNAVLIELSTADVTEICSAIGERDLRAETVAQTAWDEAAAYLAADVPVGTHLADQLILPLAISAAHGNGGTFRTLPLTEHSRTHLELVERFLPVVTCVEEDETAKVGIFPA